MHSSSTLLTFLTHWATYGYILAFFAMIVEGDLFLLAVGFLSFAGVFNPASMFLTVLTGVLFGDSIWYLLGKKFKGSPFFLIRVASRATRPFDGHLIKHPLKTIFVSKFTYGVHHLILARIGSLGLPYKKFISDDLISSLAWVLLVGGIGYLSGASLMVARHYLHYAEIVLLLVIVSYVLLNKMIALRLKKKL